MKKCFILILFLLLLCGCSFMEYKVTYDLDDTCKLEELFDNGSYKVYSYCLSNIKIKSGNEYRDLSTLLNSSDITMNDIVSKMKNSNMFNDGGSAMYDAKNYRVISCHRFTDVNNVYNTDYIIGNADMWFEDGFCK